MKRTKFLFCMLIILPLFSGTTQTFIKNEAFIIIVNKSITSQTFKRVFLRSIYMGKKTQWEDGSKIMPAMLKENVVHDEFIEQIIKKQPKAFYRYWRQRLFTGKGVPPTSYKDEKDIVNFVNENKGALAYVSADANLQDLTSIRVVSVLK